MEGIQEWDLLDVAKKEKWHIVDLLLNSISLFGFDVNRIDADGDGIIHILATKNPILLEKALEKAIKLDVNIKNREGKTALHISVENGNLQAVRALVQIKADQNLKDALGETPIFKAVQKGRQEIFYYLVKNGSFVFTTNKDGCNLLHLTARSDDFIKISQLLIKLKVKPNQTNNAGDSPLRVAISTGSCETAKLLIENGATIDLHVAIQEQQIDIIKLLVERGGIEIDSRNNYGETGLHLAVQNGRLDILEILLEAGACVNLIDQDGYSPLHLASKISDVEFSALLLTNGALINLETFNGDLPVHIAASGGNLKVLKVIQNVDLNLRNKDGYTPLHLAWENGHSQVVDYLIEAGADFTIPNKFKRKPTIKINILDKGTRRRTISHC